MFGVKYEKAKLDLRQLHQGTTWTDANGVTQQIEDMSEGHLTRLLGWLRRNAVHLDFADAMRILWAAPSDRYFDWEDEVCERDPNEWIETLDVVEAIKLRLARYETERIERAQRERLKDVLHADYSPLDMVTGTDW